MRRWIGLLALLSLVGCTSREGPSPQQSSATDEPPGTREEGLLLLMADRRFYDSFTVGSIRFQNPELAVSLATTLGRVDDVRGLPALHTLLIEGRPEVRREAAFALGLLGDSESTIHLLAALTDSDQETAVWAVAALAAMEVDLSRLLESLDSMPENARWRRLSPYLFRFPADQVRPLAERGLSRSQKEIRAASVFALARKPQLEALEVLRSQIDDSNPWVRAWVARALGQIGDRSDLARLRPLLDDSHADPTLQALRAARRLIGNGMAAAPIEWRSRILQLMADERPGVAITAIECSSVWMLDPEIGKALRQYVDSGTRREQEVALVGLAEAGDPTAGDYATRIVTAAEDWRRALAAEVAGILDDQELLEYLRLDESPRVRGAALSASLDRDSPDSREIAIGALEDDDPGVRAAVMEWLTGHPVAPADLISRAIVGEGNRQVTELRIYGVEALVARAFAEPLERGLIVENLESLARIGEYPARREAGKALVELQRAEPAIGPAGSRKSPTTYMQIVLQTDRDHRVRIETAHGTVQFELVCSQARMTCLNFLQLARQGFFDGQIFHRVVPGFVVQAGDPRGDGWGGPGYTIRDELSRMPFDRGVIGMASSGPDTAGSQFFITLSRQPHLDGRFTAFGKVVQGEAVLDQITQGDRIERVVVVR